jgi:hypothetical protein
MAQASIHFEPVKGGSEEHNRRLKFLDYVRPDRTHLNEYWQDETQSDRLATITQNFLEHHPTRKKLHAKATPIREAVVNIEEGTTMRDLLRLSSRLNERFGISIFQIAIHKDEGYFGSDTDKLNLHAHLVADWTNPTNGESIKLNRQDMAEMQTITAEVLGMQRGVSSDKKHLTAMQYKEQKAREEAERAKQEQLKAESAQRIAEHKRDAAEKAAAEARAEKAAAEKAAVSGLVVNSTKKLSNLLGFGSEAKQLKELPAQLDAAKAEGRAEAVEEVLKGAGMKYNDMSKVTPEKVGKDLMNIVHKKAEAAQEDTKKLKIIQNMTEGNYTYDAAAKLIKEKYADMAYYKEAFGYAGSADAFDFKKEVFNPLCERQGAHNTSSDEHAIGRREICAQGIVCACIRFFDSFKLDKIAKTLKAMARDFSLADWRKQQEYSRQLQEQNQERKNQEKNQGREWRRGI